MGQTRDSWTAVAGNRDRAAFVAGMFDRLAVHVSGRDERLTVVHDGRDVRDVRVEAGGDASGCDFGVTIDAAAADRLAAEAARPGLGAAERFRIVRSLFTAATAATLGKRRLASPVLKRLAGAESVILVRLVSPVRDEADATHTLVYAARQWIVIPGLHGRPQRRYDLTVDQAAEYQRQVHAVLTRDTLAGWVRFGRWYRRWRPTVSKRLPRS